MLFALYIRATTKNSIWLAFIIFKKMTFCIRQNVITIVIVVVTSIYKSNEQKSFQDHSIILDDKIWGYFF